jgi:hypothetical protein
MHNPWADEFEREQRSRDCAHGTHDDCPHLDGFGGGLNPRRLRLESGAGLCQCQCHSSCPVTSKRMAVPLATWRESCGCPGAAAERSRQERDGDVYPDFSANWAEQQRLPGYAARPPGWCAAAPPG